MRTATTYRVVFVYPEKRRRHFLAGRLTGRIARRIVANAQRIERRRPIGVWASLDRRRGWLTVTYYPLGLN